MRKIIPKINWKQIPVLWSAFISQLVFLGVLGAYVIRGSLEWLTKIKILGRVFKFARAGSLIKGLNKLIGLMDREKEKVSKEYLIELAFRNMKSKRNRTVVTIGGMALGVGAIVFLVSIGYGLEKMVISKVAKLNELRIADVGLGKTMALQMNYEVLEKIKAMEGVEEVMPSVSMVSKIKYNNSVMDVMAMAVDERYMRAVAPVLLSGDVFKDKDMSFSYKESSESGAVMGVVQEVEWLENLSLKETELLRLNVAEEKKVEVWERPEEKGDLLGYIIRTEGGYVGEEVWGEKYYEEEAELVGKNIYSEEEYSRWIRTKVPLWKVTEEGTASPYVGDNGKQRWELAYVRYKDVVVDEDSRSEYRAGDLDELLTGEGSGAVLGETTESVEASEAAEMAMVAAEENILVATDSAGVEWVEMGKTEEDTNKVKEISFQGKPAAEAYVSSGMAKLMGLEPGEAVGKKFNVYYIIPEGLIKGVKGRIQSSEIEYMIKGVVEDQSSNYYYFHLADVSRLGIGNYTQIKVSAKSDNELAGVRKSIETMGFTTTSTTDTVVEIEKIFGTLRMLLGLLGTIALAVASLGMFNTMTVSLLERTREVGVMKAIGMLSDEVKELFLAESMIMGVGGGTFGVLLGFGSGWLLSMILSSISVVKGQGWISISYVPWFFVAFIIGVSCLVGVITGWYPSKRARSISALNALRYE